MNSNILVIGGTGKTGRRVVEQLRNKGIAPRIGSRSAAIPFEWTNRNNWTEVLSGIEKMYVTYYPDLAVPGAKEAIEQLTKVAKELGVQKMVLMSGKGETEAEACEQIVINSGIDYTIVRASWFNQNWSESFFLEPILSGVVALPYADVGIPFVDAEDIAEVATEVLLNDKFNGEIIEVTGPELLNFRKVVSEIEKATGRDIQFHAISLEQYVEGMRAEGLPEDVIWLFEYLFKEVILNPDNHKVSGDITKVLGRPAKDFKTFAKQTADTGIWNHRVVETF